MLQVLRTTCYGWHTNFAVRSMSHTRTSGPLTPSQREENINISSRVCCLLSDGTFLSQWRSTPIQISDVCSRCHDTITHAHRPDDHHMLDPSSMSVVVVIATLGAFQELVDQLIVFLLLALCFFHCRFCLLAMSTILQ